MRGETWGNAEVLIGLKQLVVQELMDPGGRLVHPNARIEIARRGGHGNRDYVGIRRRLSSARGRPQYG
jgi:hypothetical protein